MNVEINKDFIANLVENIREQNAKQVREMLAELHPADIAEFFPEIEIEAQSFIISLLDNEISAGIFLELEETERKKLLRLLSPKEIAEELINEMDTDDAVDIISELSESEQGAVISQLEDKEYAQDIVDLLRYDDDTAGGLMRKEFVQVNKNWNVITAVKAMRKQAEDLEEVYSVYVVDDDNVLLGTLSLKKLLTTSSSTKLEELYNKNIYYVKADDKDENVAKIIQKYDLMEIPVVDELGRLLGIITVDDILDVVREEADEDYQLAAGITRNVAADDSILQLTKARLPWLLIGMFGGLCAASIINGFSTAMEKYKILLLFVPLIQSTAGNVGIQSSAIVVQGLANGTIKNEIFKLIGKEFLLGLLNGLGIAIIVLFFSHFWFETSYMVSAVICIALITVIIIAAVIGSSVPIILEKKGLDPAVSTGPFITTSNDIFGVFIYFLIAKMLLGF